MNCLDIITTLTILTPIAQIGIAASVAYIAFQNHKINSSSFYVNKNQLRLNLFDRRYKIFETFKDFLLKFISTANIDQNNLSEFITNTGQSEFLFGKEISEYREKVKTNSIRLMQLNKRLERGVGDDTERAEIAEEMTNLEEWFTEQNVEISKIFRKYLHFEIEAKPK